MCNYITKNDLPQLDLLLSSLLKRNASMKDEVFCFGEAKRDAGKSSSASLSEGPYGKLLYEKLGVDFCVFFCLSYVCLCFSLWMKKGRRIRREEEKRFKQLSLRCPSHSQSPDLSFFSSSSSSLSSSSSASAFYIFFFISCIISTDLISSF